MQVQETVVLEGVDEGRRGGRMIDVGKGKISPEGMAGHSSTSREGGGDATQLGEISRQDFFNRGNVSKMSMSPCSPLAPHPCRHPLLPYNANHVAAPFLPALFGIEHCST